MKLLNFINNNNKKVSFLLSFLLIIGSIALFTKGFSELAFYWDSNYYYELSQSFISEGTFNFSNYPLSIRGYLWPFFLFIIRSVFGWLFIDDKIALFLILAALYAYVLSISMPRVMSFIFKREIPTYFGLVLSLLVCVFWIGLIVYPLTDMISFSMIIILVDTLIKLSKTKNISRIISYSFVSGCIAYAIYNARSAVGLFSVMLIVTAFTIKFHEVKIKAISMVFIVIGVLLVGFPQMKINENYGKGNNMLLHADNYFGSGESLILYQLRLGITYQRYDTLVDAAKDAYQSDTYIEYNQAGLDLLQRYQLIRLDSYEQYIKMVLGNPFVFADIYMNHFKTLLDARYGEIYIDNYDARPFKLVANWLIWVIGVVSMVYTSYKLKKKRQWWKSLLSFNSIVVLGILLGSILAFPGVPEYRFFFPVYMVMYTVFILFFDEVDLKLFRKN